MLSNFILAVLLGAVLTVADGNATDSTEMYAKIFRVTNLQAYAVTLSHRVEYHFNVSYYGVKDDVVCDLLSTTVMEELFNVTSDCGPGTNTTFGWTQFADGSAQLDIMRQRSDTVAQIGTRKIGQNETRWEGNGQFIHQVYVGPQNFTTPTIYAAISVA